MTNTLYYGDNLEVLREHIADDSVDLVIDPPFNSNAGYNHGRRRTKGVRDEIASHPLIETEFGRFPAMQVVTIAELIHGPKPKLPPLISPVREARHGSRRGRVIRKVRKGSCCKERSY